MQAASRKRMDDQVAIAIEDWAIGAYLSAGLAAAGLLWAGLVSLPPNTRPRRALRGAGRGGVTGAVLAGAGLSVGVGAWLAVAGGAAGQGRHQFEARGLGGAVAGGMAGMLFGAGLGAVRRPASSVAG